MDLVVREKCLEQCLTQCIRCYYYSAVEIIPKCQLYIVITLGCGCLGGRYVGLYLERDNRKGLQAPKHPAMWIFFFLT